MASSARAPGTTAVTVAQHGTPNRTYVRPLTWPAPVVAPLTPASLYIRNLPDKLAKQDLKRNLYMLFATYGVILDVVALKTMKMRGQAHVVFRDIDTSTQAMRALQGFTFFGKDIVRLLLPGIPQVTLKNFDLGPDLAPTDSSCSKLRTPRQSPTR